VASSPRNCPPFADGQVLKLCADFERGLYGALKQA